MVAAIQDLAKEPNQDCAAPVASFLEACNLIFENGLLSRRRINRLQSPVIQNRIFWKHGATAMKKHVF